jgi:nicotinate-nucleotide pyrophosphorylase (carboxylating)
MSYILDAKEVEKLVRSTLQEDKSEQDITTQNLEMFLKLRGKEPDQNQSFIVIAKSDGVFSGSDWVKAVETVAGISVEPRWKEGENFSKGSVVVHGRGSYKKILNVERTLLNGLQALCGVASVTREYVRTVKRIWCDEKALKESLVPGVFHTRKTIPLLRDLQFKAVESGGGQLHRRDLNERILFKENHKYIVRQKGLSFSEIVTFIVSIQPDAQFEVETLGEAEEAVQAGARHLLLDNFKSEEIEKAGAEIHPRGIFLEVSGGIRLDSIGQFLFPGISRLSVGALTNQVRPKDLSLDWI